MLGLGWGRARALDPEELLGWEWILMRELRWESVRAQGSDARTGRASGPLKARMWERTLGRWRESELNRWRWALRASAPRASARQRVPWPGSESRSGPPGHLGCPLAWGQDLSSGQGLVWGQGIRQA
jgi:hypothetical protein